MCLLALAAITAATPSNGMCSSCSAVCTCAKGRLRLRGGSLEDEQDARERRMAASIGKLRGMASMLEDMVPEDDEKVGCHLYVCPLCAPCMLII